MVLIVLLLTGLYAAVLASFHPLDLLFAAVSSGAALYVFRAFVFGGRPGPLPALFARCVAFFPFVGAVLWDIVKGTWRVALAVLHLRPITRPGMIKVPVGERTPTGVAVSALTATLSPGTVLIESNEEFMLFHVVDASDPEAVREHRENLYRRYQRKVFP